MRQENPAGKDRDRHRLLRQHFVRDRQAHSTVARRRGHFQAQKKRARPVDGGWVKNGHIAITTDNPNGFILKSGKIVRMEPPAK